jgi:hypothetical protein
MSRRAPKIPLADRWLLVAALISVFGAHVFLIGYKTYANVDEAYASALASRLLDGQRLYVGAISQRGPMMYLSYEAFARLVAFVVCELMVVLTYWATRVTLSQRVAPLAAGITAYALSYGFPILDGVALNGELLQAPLLIVSFVFGCLAMRHLGRRRLAWLAIAGFSFGVAACIKQSAILHLAPIMLWLVASHRRGSWKSVVECLATVLGSALALPAAFIAYAASIGTLRDAFFYTFTYNTQVHLRPLPDEHPWVRNFLGATSDNRLFDFAVIALVVGGIYGFVARAMRGRANGVAKPWLRFGMREYLSLHVIIAVGSASLLVRFFPHYFVAALPFVAMGVAYLAAKLIPPLSVGARRVAFGVGALFLVASGAITANFCEVADGRATETPSVKVVARYIEAITSPEDRIFVWGFSPTLYGYSNRKPAGRYLFSTYVTGFVPWFWDAMKYEPSRVVPGSVEALISDLDREKPKIVVDAGSVMLARSMRAYPEFDAWMQRSLCFLVRINAYDLYIRKEGACPTDSFPKLHAPEDFNGHRLLVAMPRPLDDATSRRLPSGPEHRPVWFPEEPTPPMIDVATDAHIEKDLAKERARNATAVLPGEDPSQAQ